MNRAHSAIASALRWQAGLRGGWVIGLAVAWFTASAWGQSAVWQPQGATTGNIYYNGGNVGIGTSNPSSALDVAGSANVAGSIAQLCNGAGGVPPTRVTGTVLCTNFVGGQSAVDFWNTAPGFYGGFQFHQVTGAGAQLTLMTITGSGNVGIGTTSPTQKLSVNGTILAKEVIVQSGWADYVFDPGYMLKPLGEVGAYIAEHRRLPDMPSAAEVQEKGVGLGEIQAKLLAKVEELTLHLIQQDKDNRELRARIAELEKRVAGAAGAVSGR